MSLSGYNTEPCGDPVPINNGKVIISGRTPGSNATYLCNDHYQLIGNAAIVCQSDSQWLGTVPKCKRKHVVSLLVLYLHTIYVAIVS